VKKSTAISAGQCASHKRLPRDNAFRTGRDRPTPTFSGPAAWRTRLAGGIHSL